ncbi:MAG: hypothetical protein J3Q66DRAFT_393904 [Benniella sp.]|nr:MAG: hypothetical protein J3Q66DRAFT_393904 [Benniella sp.]
MRIPWQLSVTPLGPTAPQILFLTLKSPRLDSPRWSQGQIGIKLSRKVIVTEATIEHVDPRIAQHNGMHCARWRFGGFTSSEMQSREGYHTLLTTIVYNYAGHESKQPKLMQSFQVPLEKQDVVSTGVVVRVNSIWDNPDLPYLFRVRIVDVAGVEAPSSMRPKRSN